MSAGDLVILQGVSVCYPPRMKPPSRRDPSVRARAERADTSAAPTANAESMFRAIHAVLRGEQPHLPAGIRFPALALPSPRPGEQRRELVRGSGFTYRDEANAIAAHVFRNGFLEDLHAGRSSPLLLDEDCSRISQGEMKRLMIETSAKLASWLGMRDKVLDKKPYDYLIALSGIRAAFTNHWDRAALTAAVPSTESGVLPLCHRCSCPLDETWSYCPRCGANSRRPPATS